MYNKVLLSQLYFQREGVCSRAASISLDNSSPGETFHYMSTGPRIVATRWQPSEHRNQAISKYILICN